MSASKTSRARLSSLIGNCPENGRPVNKHTHQTMTYKLRGLEAKARYEFENLDGGKEVRTGRELMSHGLTVTLEDKPSAAVIAYRRVK